MKKPPVNAKGGKAPAGKKRGLGHIKKAGAVTVHSHKPAPGGKTGHHVHHAHHPVHHRAPVKKAKAPVKRKWSPGADVACCSAEALGFLLGWDPEAVLDLYWSVCSDPNEGASIAGTLAAAGCSSCEWTDSVTPGASLILGVTLPEPHAVAVTPDGTWWSWGEPFHPSDWPDLAIEESWAILL